MSRSFLIFCFCLFSFSWLWGADAIFVDKEVIHEAFITQEFGAAIYEIILESPPQPIEEIAPKKPAQNMEWIAGYWLWSVERGDFIWIAGTWRRAPLGQKWISGKWERVDGGFVRLPGFWSALEEKKLQYIPLPPPDPIDQKIPLPSSSAFFWILGYFEYNFEEEKYHWLEGRWQPFEQDWVYVPARYIWREKGYVFLPAFWDWPLKERGQLYASVYIKPEVRGSIVYEPKMILEEATILESLLPYWPYYLYLFRTHFHLFPGFNEIPWWQWDEWWCFTWKDQLALFWWWSHPGYPQPLWLNQGLAEQITPPSPFILNLMKRIRVPLHVTPEGVIGNRSLLEAIESVTLSRAPLLPLQEKEEVERRIVTDGVKRPFLRPSAEKMEEAPPKPNFGPAREELTRAPERVVITPLPKMPEPPLPRLPKVYPTSNLPVKRNPYRYAEYRMKKIKEQAKWQTK